MALIFWPLKSRLYSEITFPEKEAEKLRPPIGVSSDSTRKVLVPSEQEGLKSVKSMLRSRCPLNVRFSWISSPSMRHDWISPNVGDGSARPSRIAEFFSAQMGIAAGSLPCWKAFGCCTSCTRSRIKSSVLIAIFNAAFSRSLWIFSEMCIKTFQVKRHQEGRCVMFQSCEWELHLFSQRRPRYSHLHDQLLPSLPQVSKYTFNFARLPPAVHNNRSEWLYFALGLPPQRRDLCQISWCFHPYDIAKFYRPLCGDSHSLQLLCTVGEIGCA